MFIIVDYTFFPGAEYLGYIVVPGVYKAENFAAINNVTRNIPLYIPNVHETTVVTDESGGFTTVYFAQNTSFCTPDDNIQVVCYPTNSGGGVGSDVNVLNFPPIQAVSGTVEVTNDVGNPLPVTFPSGVTVNNFPAVQPVSGSVSVDNFPATQSVTQGTSPWVVSGTVAVSSVTGTVTVGGNVTVDNFPATQTVDGTVDIGNFPATQTVDGAVTVSGSVSVDNFPATQTVDGSVTVSGSVSVDNFPTTFDVGNFPATQTVDGTVNVGNFPATQTVDGAVTVSGTVDIGNFPSTQTVDGTVEVTQGTDPWVVSGTVSTGPISVQSFPAMATDAFNRLRVSNPFTLFDSSFRYGDNNLWATALVGGGTATFNPAQGLMDLRVTGAVGDAVSRQTTKVFSYQPGKSLLLLTTFVMAPAATGLTQQVGYYSAANGYFLQLQDANVSLVERSSVTGAVVNTPVLQADWNVDPMDGTGPSGITLDITKAQILFVDMEWLGVGTVRMGFVIDGQFVPCHYFQHANLITSTYITTASLPLSCSIQDTAGTGIPSTFKQICATVISEGGYTLAGLQQSVGTPITTPKTLTIAGTFYPVVSIRLKSNRLDAIVIMTAISLLGSGNNETYRWQVMANTATAGGTWTDAGLGGAVEYNLTGTAVTGGRILASGFMSASNQGSPSIDILKEALFANQLERNPFTNTPYELCVAVAGAGASQLVYASMDWEEVSR